MKNDIKIAVIGLGYVGLPLAVAFSKKYSVIGFDLNLAKIEKLRQGIDETLEVSNQQLSEAQISYCNNIDELQAANFFVVTVPTPIDSAKRPDLSALISASKMIGSVLKSGDIVVYESTVYPGVTEDVCLPLLESESGLKAPQDFAVGYSPERINPGDKEHSFTNIKKVVSAQTETALQIVVDVYKSVVTAGIHPVTNIKTAEAAKVIENTQRDLNIALINELAIIFNKMDLDTLEVLEAAGTKWNFLPFRPGLVGGHCIGVDPYYLTHKAESLGLHPQVILSGRRINDGMGKYIAEQTVKLLAQSNRIIKGAKIGLLGLTFKEDCPDVRNTRVIDIYQELSSYHTKVLVHDPIADSEISCNAYSIELISWNDLENLDAIIIAVAHNEFKQKSLEEYLQKLTKPKIIIDVKGIIDPKLAKNKNITLWRL